VKRFFTGVALSFLIVAVAVGILAWVSFQAPSWYVPSNKESPEVVRLADRAEHHFNETIHKVRPETEVWRIRLGDEAMNAWLSARLEGWLTHDQDIELPPELHDPQVHATTGGLWTYANVEISDGYPRPLGVLWWVWIDGSTTHVEPLAIRLGKLPIPMSLFTEQIEELREEMKGFEAKIPLLDDRVVEIQHVAFEDGAIVMTCRTTLP
jgi:hypothetical protein